MTLRFSDSPLAKNVQQKNLILSNKIPFSPFFDSRNTYSIVMDLLCVFALIRRPYDDVLWENNFIF